MSANIPGDTGEVVSNRILTIPNLISFARLAMLPVFLVVYVSGHFLAATILLIVVGTTDFLDGFLARALNQVSVLGKLLDPLADRLVIISALLAFGIKHVLPWWVVGLVVARDVIIIVAFGILEKRGMPRLPVNQTGKRATAALFVGFGFVAGGVLFKVSGVAFIHARATLCRDIGLAGVAVGTVLYYAAGVLYAKEVRRHLAAHPAPPQAPAAGTR